MYIKVNNPNDFVRKFLCKQFNNYDISDIESVSDIVDSFQYICNFFPKIHEFILKIMYQDYFVERKGLGQKYESCKDIDELYFKISEDPFLIVEMLQEVFNFSQSSFLQKKEKLSILNTTLKYEENINELYKLDLLQYCRKLTKEDLLCLFYDFILKYNNYDEIDREFYATDDLEDFIFELYGVDLGNYCALSNQIIEEGYYFLKNKSTVDKLRDADNDRLLFLENNKLNCLNHAMIDDDLFLSDILYYFIEFNKLSEVQQQEIKIKIKKQFL